MCYWLIRFRSIGSLSSESSLLDCTIKQRQDDKQPLSSWSGLSDRQSEIDGQLFQTSSLFSSYSVVVSVLRQSTAKNYKKKRKKKKRQ